jgi:hypothetical protein
MLINLSCFAPLFCFTRIVSYGRSPYQSVFILKPFTVTINELCHDSSVCFLFFLLLFLRQLSVDLHVIMVRSTSCFDDLFIALRRSHRYLVFTCVCTCFLSVCNVISDVSYFAPVGYKSREVFLSLCFFCTAYRAATTVTTILHKYIELICGPPFQLINVSP